MSSVSFTVRRPSPVSRGDSDSEGFKVPTLPQRLLSGGGGSAPGSPLGNSRNQSPAPRAKPSARSYQERDSSDEEDEETDELVTGFDQFGVQRWVPSPLGPCRAPIIKLTTGFGHYRLHEKKAQGPLVIAPLANRDWREAARARKAATQTGRFIPGAGAAQTGADGSVGGLGTRDSINSGPQLRGIQVTKRQKRNDNQVPSDNDAMEDDTNEPEAQESDDQRALRLLLSGEDNAQEELAPIIPQLTRTLSEAEALKQDVQELPEQSSLDDYDRVPVSQFGAAMLRGMGWSEGNAAGPPRKDGKARPDVKPWLPERRTALLGIGAKEQEVFDDGDPRAKKKGKASLKYMPVAKREKEGSSREPERERVSGKSDHSEHRERDRSERESSRSNGRDRDRDRGDDRQRSDYDNRRRGRDDDRHRDHDRSRDDDGYRRDRQDTDDPDRRDKYDRERRDGHARDDRDRRDNRRDSNRESDRYDKGRKTAGIR